MTPSSARHTEQTEELVSILRISDIITNAKLIGNLDVLYDNSHINNFFASINNLIYRERFIRRKLNIPLFGLVLSESIQSAYEKVLKFFRVVIIALPGRTQ